MTRVYVWLQRHPTLVDGVMAAVMVFFGVLSVFERNPFLPTVAGVLIGAPLLFRRRYPTVSFWAVYAFGAVEALWGHRPTVSALAVPMAMYAYAAYRPRRLSLVGLGVGMVGVGVALTQWITAPARQNNSSFDWVFVYCVFVAPLIIAWVLGDSMRYRRAYYLDLEDKARRLERERDQQAQIGAAAERARIARELHDVVAHHVSVMVVQAEGASYALDTSPETTRRALGTIAETGRSALAEMRRLIGVLRSEGNTADRAPQPGVDQLEDLLEQVRATGIAVDFKVEGVPVPLPQGMALAAYRIVQESLTNTRKHGGPRVSAQVSLHYGEDELRMLVRDDGRGASALTDGKGNGLTGMRERVAMYGGALQAGPRLEGGYQVEAVLPYRAALIRDAA
ncbi:MAG TPA: histidine kinase [Actinocrinis sp.]|uniref:sensor histidine kinase n=1 Tax=Actinocrinis sp. TaxID=1920516 RepID=UPI002D228F37|nr:histidine kinase [Actinocrinis sp.]HZU57085.1 histidine kinase [Actinocrinis sp.]